MSRLEDVSKWAGSIGGIGAFVISILGIVYGYGSQGGQVGLLEDRVHSLEAKLDVLTADIGDLRLRDSKTAGTESTLADNCKNLAAQLASVASNIADLEREVRQLDSRTSQNTSGLADAYRKFTAVNPTVQRCLDLADELESGFRSTPMGSSAVDRTTVVDAMRQLNCTSMPH